jgi:hypothetical protein
MTWKVPFPGNLTPVADAADIRKKDQKKATPTPKK